MLSVLRRVVRYLAMEHGKGSGLYRRLCQPRNDEYAEFLRRHGGLYAMGEQCLINRTVNITNPEYVRLGNNVCLSTCNLVCHDGSVAVFARAYQTPLENFGKIDIGDNVFVGLNAVILPGVTIGSNAIVAAGAVVTKNVESGTIVAGVPARKMGLVDDFVGRVREKTQQVPWSEKIKIAWQYTPRSPELTRLRQAYFFENDQQSGNLLSEEALPTREPVEA